MSLGGTETLIANIWLGNFPASENWGIGMRPALNQMIQKGFHYLQSPSWFSVFLYHLVLNRKL